MNDDIRKLLGGYATNSLTHAEQQRLYRAALEDAELFDALAEEQGLKDLLDDPAVRGELLDSLEKQEEPSWWKWFLQPAAVAVMGMILVSVVGVIWMMQQRNQSAVETAKVTTPAPPAVSPPPASAPSPAPKALEQPVMTSEAAPTQGPSAASPPRAAELSSSLEEQTSVETDRRPESRPATGPGGKGVIGGVPATSSSPLLRDEKESRRQDLAAPTPPASPAKMRPSTDMVVAATPITAPKKAVEKAGRSAAAPAPPAAASTSQAVSVESVSVLKEEKPAESGSADAKTSGERKMTAAARTVAGAPPQVAAGAGGPVPVLRYSLRRRAPDGKEDAVASEFRFHSGDQVRVVIESDLAGVVALEQVGRGAVFTSAIQPGRPVTATVRIPAQGDVPAYSLRLQPQPGFGTLGGSGSFRASDASGAATTQSSTTTLLVPVMIRRR